MNTNQGKVLLLKTEVFQIIGCSIDLRITGLRVGVILNFKHRNLEWERIAL
jgi:hypothetical protein